MSQSTRSAASPVPAASMPVTPTERLRSLVQYAVLAPSSHNTQPWLFRVLDDALELRADRTRALAVVDPEDRSLVASCGAALGMLRVAIRRFGHTPEVELLPDAGDPDLMARVRLGEFHEPTEEQEALFLAIRRRHTNRRPFDGRPVPESLLARLHAVAKREGIWLRVATSTPAKEAIAALVAEGDRRQAADPAFRRELAAWLHPNRSRSHDGMPGSALGFGDIASMTVPWIIRTFDWGNGQAARDRQLAAGSPALLVLGTELDSPAAWLRTGQALALLLLHAGVAGVSASFLNQPIEVPALRTELAHVVGAKGHPQLVLRLGYGPAVPATPRRAVEDVIAE